MLCAFKLRLIRRIRNVKAKMREGRCRCKRICPLHRSVMKACSGIMSRRLLKIVVRWWRVARNALGLVMRRTSRQRPLSRRWRLGFRRPPRLQRCNRPRLEHKRYLLRRGQALQILLG